MELVSEKQARISAYDKLISDTETELETKQNDYNKVMMAFGIRDIIKDLESNGYYDINIDGITINKAPQFILEDIKKLEKQLDELKKSKERFLSK